MSGFSLYEICERSVIVNRCKLSHKLVELRSLNFEHDDLRTLRLEYRIKATAFNAEVDGTFRYVKTCLVWTVAAVHNECSWRVFRRSNNQRFLAIRASDFFHVLKALDHIKHYSNLLSSPWGCNILTPMMFQPDYGFGPAKWLPWLIAAAIVYGLLGLIPGMDKPITEIGTIVGVVAITALRKKISEWFSR